MKFTKRELRFMLGELLIRIAAIELSIPKSKPNGHYAKEQQKTRNKLIKLTENIRKELGYAN